MSRPWLLLDRDDTILDDPGYLSDPKGLKFLPGALEGMVRFAQADWPLVVITNQSGLGRGLFTSAQLKAVHEAFEQQLQQAGVSLTGLYYCPHHPEEGCRCRKPQVLLALRASQEHELCLDQAVVVGDKDSDLELGRRIGARYLAQLRAKGQPNLSADGVFDSLHDLAQALL